jgi:hypothetical protein
MGSFTPHRGTHRFISNDTPISWESSLHMATQCSISVSERNDTPISWAHPNHGLSHRSTHSVYVLEDVSHNCNHQHSTPFQIRGIIQYIVDKVTSPSILSSLTWKALGFPKLVSAIYELLTFNRILAWEPWPPRSYTT